MSLKNSREELWEYADSDKDELVVGSGYGKYYDQNYLIFTTGNEEAGVDCYVPVKKVRELRDYLNTWLVKNG
jgi:hypothetical protein